MRERFRQRKEKTNKDNDKAWWLLRICVSKRDTARFARILTVILIFAGVMLGVVGRLIYGNFRQG